jgi:hypothetical protein
MGTLSAHNVTIDLPTGWEGRISQRDMSSSSSARVASTEPDPTTTGALLQTANFALPASTGDFGGGAVELMTNVDLFVVLFEYDRASARAPMFASTGVPRLGVDDFSSVTLQRVLDGQGGAQRFFNEAGRAMCLYVVLGSHARRVRTIPVINDLLSTLRIS